MQSMQQRRKNAIRLYKVAIKSWEDILINVSTRSHNIREDLIKKANSKIANLKKTIAFTEAKLQYE